MPEGTAGHKGYLDFAVEVGAELNRYQAQKMRTHGLFSHVHDEVGDVIVADVSADSVKPCSPPTGTA